jgi:hypothetical protein
LISNHFGDSVGGSEKAGVGGSIPSLATNIFNNLPTARNIQISSRVQYAFIGYPTFALSQIGSITSTFPASCRWFWQCAAAPAWDSVPYARRARMRILLPAKNKEVIDIVGLNEIVFIDKYKASAPSLLDYSLPIDAVVVCLTVSVNDAKQSSRAHRLTSSLEQSDRLRYFVIGLQEQHSVNTSLWKKRIVLLTENRPNVCKGLTFGPLLDMFQIITIDLNSVNETIIAYATRSSHRKPTRACSNIRNSGSFSNAEEIHDAVDLKLLLPFRIFKH